MSITFERRINAPAERIWSVLTDPDMLTAGGFGIAAVDGGFQPGAALSIAFAEAPERRIPMRVDRFEAPRDLSLVHSMFFGLIQARVGFYLQQLDDTTLVECSLGTGGFIGRKANRRLDALSPRVEAFMDALASASEGA